jgi:hypothetical protein
MPLITSTKCESASARSIVRSGLGRFDKSAPHVAQLRGKFNLESSVFPSTDGNEVATTFIENRGKLLLHLLCGQVPAPYMPGDYQLHEAI